MRGRQEPGPEWRRLCGELRRGVLELCPLENRRFHNLPGTFPRTIVAEQSGVNFHMLRRLLDKKQTVEADTAIALGEWMGWELRWVKVGETPAPPAAADSAASKAKPRAKARRRKER